MSSRSRYAHVAAEDMIVSGKLKGASPMFAATRVARTGIGVDAGSPLR
jgi:hypothetical protein